MIRDYSDTASAFERYAHLVVDVCSIKLRRIHNFACLRGQAVENLLRPVRANPEQHERTEAQTTDRLTYMAHHVGIWEGIVCGRSGFVRINEDECSPIAYMCTVSTH